MRPEGSGAVLEARRRLAVRLLNVKQPRGVLAGLVGVHRCTLWRWQRAAQQGGTAALAARSHPGPRPRLSLRQRRRLARVASPGPDRAWLADEPVDRTPDGRIDPSAFWGALPPRARATLVALDGPLAVRNPSAMPANAMRPPSPIGVATAGRRSKKGPPRAPLDGLLR